MAKYTATLDLRITKRQREAIEEWSRVTEWSIPDLVRHFLPSDPPELSEDGDLDRVVELRQAALEAFDAVEEAAGRSDPGGERR